jgi:hypothetical protein
LCRQRVVRRIDAHQRLSAVDDLACVDQSRHHLAADAEAEVALHAGPDNAGEFPIASFGHPGRCDPDQWRIGARVRCGSAASRQYGGQD